MPSSAGQLPGTSEAVGRLHAPRRSKRAEDNCSQARGQGPMRRRSSVPPDRVQEELSNSGEQETRGLVPLPLGSQEANVEQLEGKLAAAEARQMSSNETASNKDARIITLERNAEVLTRSAADAKSERIEIESLVSGLRADLEAKDMAVVKASILS